MNLTNNARHNVPTEKKTRIAWLREGEKSSRIRLAVSIQHTNVRDRQTPHDSIGRAMQYAYSVTRQKRASSEPGALALVLRSRRKQLLGEYLVPDTLTAR